MALNNPHNIFSPWLRVSGARKSATVRQSDNEPAHQSVAGARAETPLTARPAGANQ
jgi:hypothetical protein